MTRRALVIARAELLLLRRSRVAWLALATLFALSAVAAATSWSHVESERADRAEQQRVTDALFDAQPERHPHRMVHYGTYVFRPPGPLAAFDPGVDSYTGTTIYLEGHRQNTATFAAVRESSSLVRFGQLTPAFVLQTLAPLLLVFLGFGSVAREREHGTLPQLLAQGASAGEILFGKAVALGVVAAFALMPVLASAIVAGVGAHQEFAPAAAVVAAATAYLATWVVLVVAVSAFARSRHAALATLVAAWLCAAVLVPRLGAEYAARAVALPSAAETDLVLKAELRKLGDSHDADDPFFAAFRERTLARYGVQRIEDLPVNYRGLVSAEGEALTSKLFAAYAARTAEHMRAQVDRLYLAQFASPALALRRVTLVAAGTDLETHLAFLRQAEAHRYDLVQRLNRVHAEHVTLASDAERNRDAASDRRARVAAHTWSEMPDFQFEAESGYERAVRSGSALAMLGLWLAASVALLLVARRRLLPGAA